MRVVAALLTFLLAGCVVAADTAPRSFDEVELARISSEMVVPSSTSPSVATGEEVELWFVVDDQLVPTIRTVDSLAPEFLLSLLISGPGGDEDDLRSAVPSTAVVLGVERIDRQVRVNLSRDFALVGGTEELLAVGQFVATLTGLEGIDRVSFALDGADTAVPDGQGVLRDSLTRADILPHVRSESGG